MQVSNRDVGVVALVAAVWLVIGNVTHPVGTTEMYTSGVEFVEHGANTYWVVNHLLLALATLTAPWLAWAWWRKLNEPASQSWGTYALILVALGTVFSVFHLGGVDGVGIPAYAAVLESNGAAAAAGAEALLKVHLASITTWSLLLWGGAQTVLGVAEVAEGRRSWLGWLLIVCGLLGFAFAGSIAIQGHLTGFTEGVLLRGSTVGFTIWFIWTAWQLARTPEVAEHPA